MAALKERTLQEIQAHAVKRGCTLDSIHRFAERYAERCRFRENGWPIGVVPRLRMALEFALQGMGREMPVRRASLIQDLPDTACGRRIFDIELPADEWNPQPYSIRIVTDAAVTCVITVLPPEFRKDMAAKKKHRELRRIVDADIEIAEPEAPIDVPLPTPVRAGTSLGDLLVAFRK